jgi:hypothetical protein
MHCTDITTIIKEKAPSTIFPRLLLQHFWIRVCVWYDDYANCGDSYLLTRAHSHSCAIEFEWQNKFYVIFVNTRCERKLKLRENWLILENDFCLRLVHENLVIKFCWKEREKLSLFECACVSGESKIKKMFTSNPECDFSLSQVGLITTLSFL